MYVHVTELDAARNKTFFYIMYIYKIEILVPHEVR